MPLKTFLTVLSLCLIFITSLAAASPTELKDAILRDQSATDPLWLNLLQYDTSKAQPVSDILPGNFFLSSNGHRNPEAELLAFVDAAYEPIPADPNTHAICRFPARALFLERNLDVTDLPEIACPLFYNWSGQGRITDATLILASGSLGDPATFYGHILLKFTTNATFSGNAPLETGRGNLLDTSLNYGAIFPEGEHAAIYVLKGLFGGYSSTYSSIEYYEQRSNYVQTQDRDLWEYRLNLSPDEIELLVANSWELYRQENKYYFLSKNCGYRFAELLAMATGQDIDFQGKPWSLPLDVFVDLADMTGSNGLPLVSGVDRIYAPTNRFLSAYEDLSAEQKEALEVSIRSALLHDQRYSPVDYFNRSDVSDQDRSEVVEVALLYIAMVRSRHESDQAKDDVRQLTQAFLSQRIQLPAGDTRIGLDNDVPYPHEGHRSSMFQISYLSNSRLGGGVEIRLRPVLTDFLSLQVAAVPFSELSMGDTSVILRNDKVRLQKLDVLQITSIPTRRTTLPYEYRPSWRMRFGAESPSIIKDGDVVAFAEYARGHAFSPTPDSAVFGMIEGRIDSGPDTLQGGLRIGAVARLNDELQLAFSARSLTPLQENISPLLQSEFTIRLGQQKDQDFRLVSRFESDYDRHVTTELGLAYSWHF